MLKRLLSGAFKDRGMAPGAGWNTARAFEVQQFTAVSAAQNSDACDFTGMPFRESAARLVQVPELKLCGLRQPRKPLQQGLFHGQRAETQPVGDFAFLHRQLLACVVEIAADERMHFVGFLTGQFAHIDSGPVGRIQRVGEGGFGTRGSSGQAVLRTLQHDIVGLDEAFPACLCLVRLLVHAPAP
jgi:hypothetical protein